MSTSNSKQAILDALRKRTIASSELPALEGEWIRYADGKAKFAEMIGAVGGRCVTVDGLDAIRADLEATPTFTQADKTVSLVDGIPSLNVSLETVEDPHDLEDIDYAIVPAQLGVAENGAVWIDAGSDKQRVIYFIAQHVVVVLEAGQLVHNMHEAYERLEFDGPGFGMFMSGPSKTADIEQSLVIGAHGARSLTLYLISS